MPDQTHYQLKFKQWLESFGNRQGIEETQLIRNELFQVSRLGFGSS